MNIPFPMSSSSSVTNTGDVILIGCIQITEVIVTWTRSMHGVGLRYIILL